MGGSQSEVVVIPKICEVKRSNFQNKLLDMNAAYSLMQYYYSIIKNADLNNNGRPPKMISDVQNFNEDAVKRIRKRTAAGEEAIDGKLYTYFQNFEKSYNDLEGDVARLKMLHEAVSKCYEVLKLFSKNMYVLCEADKKVEYMDDDFLYMESNNIIEKEITLKE